MKWITHQTGAVFGALLLQLSPLAIAAALVGGILPDIIDQKLSASGRSSKARQKIFNKIHRGPSHWFVWWLLAFLCCSSISHMPGREIAAGLALGGLSHVALDMLTSRGVPIMPFSRKGSLSLHLCSTGSWREYVFLLFLICATLYLLYSRYWRILELSV